jgi:S1-C subfamily serine protease
VPGRIVGNYYPLVTITAFDCKTGHSVWYGTAVSCSNNPDVRVSSQLLVRHLLGKMPPCEKAVANNPVGTGMLGVHFVPFSPDGDSIYPLILGADKGKPAARAGLRLGDIILAIDGIATANLAFGDVIKIIRGDVGSECVLSIDRDKKVFEVRLKRVARTPD